MTRAFDAVEVNQLRLQVIQAKRGAIARGQADQSQYEMVMAEFDRIPVSSPDSEDWGKGMKGAFGEES